MKFLVYFRTEPQLKNIVLILCNEDGVVQDINSSAISYFNIDLS